MVRTLSALDTSPLTRPVWVRLALPGRSDACRAGRSGPEFRLALNRLWSRWERRWGSPVQLAWKVEFTTGGADGLGRVAPHLHALATVPEGVAYGVWEAWLAFAWVNSVGLDAGALDGLELAAFWRHGVWTAPVDGDRLGPRAARYLAHFKPGSSGLRHQDQPPDEWLEPGMGLRRLWGVRGLVALESETGLSDLEAVWVARILRRWDRATNGPIRVRRRRANGRLVHLVRRHPLSRQAGGWLLVEGAERVADRALTAARLVCGEEGSRGAPAALVPPSGAA